MRSIAARLETALVALCLVAAGLLALAAPADADGPGSLDTSWHGTGIATTNIGGVDIANAVVVQPDGKTVAAGYAQSSSGSEPHFGLVRYTSTGSLDTGFGAGGEVVTPSFFTSTNGDQANAVALQSDGKIVVAGSASDSSGNGALAVARYKSDGTPDTLFGSGGNGQAMVQIAGGSYNAGQAMTIEPNGDIVVVGSWFGGWAVARFTPAGVLDPSFNPSGSQPGVQTFDLGDSFFDNAYAVTTETVNGQTDILVGGSAAHNPAAGAGAGNEDFGLVRLTDTGAFDASFNTTGVEKTDFGGDSDQISALVVQPDGKILAAGQSGNANGAHSLALARYLPNGALDTTFHNTGSEVIGPVAATDAMRGLGVMPDGTILAAVTASANQGDVALVRLLPSGALDNSFGVSGVVTTNVAQDQANALALDPANGRVVVAGTARTDATHASFLVTRYLSPLVFPTITSVSPTSGSTAGGNTVTINGTGLTSAIGVTFSGTPAPTFTIVNASTIVAVAPAHAAGVVNVRVVTETEGDASPIVDADKYRYEAAPTITSVSPPAGLPAGGNTVTINGTGFTDASAVNFGATPATSFTVVNATRITAVVPAHAAGSVDVQVVNPIGTSSTGAADTYTYEAAPTITSISPTGGLPAGGNTITVNGTGFIGTSEVLFGAADATGVSVINANKLTAVVPAHAAGTVNVRVVTPSGTSAVVAADKYAYRAAPTVTSLSPRAGRPAGGNTITVKGTGFTGASAVNFGATPASSFTVVSGTRITAVVPAHSAGAVDVQVVTQSGTSPVVNGDVYTYEAAPTVTSVSPTSGSTAGGNTVTVNGTGFIGASTVKFGNVAATGVTVVNAGKITAVAPAHAAGTVHVRVVTPSGTSPTAAADRYKYGP